jgi:light-regulated signal transduction histidine kinase (bacteriophytochrome)
MEAEVYQRSQEIQSINRQLQSANAELEAFSYSVSHDLRAPLRHIHGFVEMLTRESGPVLSEKGHRYLRTIASASREMGQLIDDLLSFSRMGRAEMHETSIDLLPLIEETRRALEPVIGDREIHWKIAPLPRIQGDPAMLSQVFVNLLGNAVKYTRGRTPAEIEIGVQRRGGRPHHLFRTRQRRGLRPALRGQTVRRLSAPAPRRRVRGHRHRPGQCAPDHDPPRRPYLGRGPGQPGRHVLLHPPACHPSLIPFP